MCNHRLQACILDHKRCRTQSREGSPGYSRCQEEGPSTHRTDSTGRQSIDNRQVPPWSRQKDRPQVHCHPDIGPSTYRLWQRPADSQTTAYQCQGESNTVRRSTREKVKMCRPRCFQNKDSLRHLQCSRRHIRVRKSNRQKEHANSSKDFKTRPPTHPANWSAIFGASCWRVPRVRDTTGGRRNFITGVT